MHQLPFPKSALAQKNVRTVAPDVTLAGEDKVRQRLDGHPTNRQAPFGFPLVDFIVFSKTEIGNLADLIKSN